MPQGIYKEDITMISAGDFRNGLTVLIEGNIYQILEFQHEGNVFSVEPPISVELEVTETEPGVKGDTATGATKPAIVETGASVLVPLFVNQGDKIKIDTRTGEYSSRA